MTRATVFAAALSLAALMTALPAAAAKKPSPPQGTPEQKQTIQDIRTVGTAMWTWYKKEMEPKRSEDAHKAQVRYSEQKALSISEVPVISREELTRILVPKYIAAIPEKDGWGHPYEFHLNTQNPNALSVMGLRSAGADGRFSGDTYTVDSFPGADTNQDIAWIDGYFVRWPQPAEKSK